MLAESSREAPEFWATVGVFQLGEDREIRLLAYAGTAQRRAERAKKGVGDPGTIVVEVEFGQRLVVWTGGQARKHDMGRLKERDIADVVDCLRDAYALTDIDTFRGAAHLEVAEGIGLQRDSFRQLRPPQHAIGIRGGSS